jgi:sugar transferase (PEP-CTERM system associated)
MIVPYNRRVALLTAFELALAALVFFTAFLVVVSAHRPGLHIQSAVVAHLTFVFSLLVPAGMLGVHRLDRGEAFRSFVQKFLASIAAGVLLCYATFALVPSIAPYREAIPDAVAIGALGLVAVRVLLARGLPWAPLQHRVLVLGTSGEAVVLDQALRGLAGRGISVVGFYHMDPSSPIEVAPDKVLRPVDSLESLVDRLNIQEIVVAVREQRGGVVPLSQLLNCRLRGVQVTDVPGVLERVTGAVPVETLKASWLIYGKGFEQGWARRTVKRGFDLVVATALLVVAAPIMLAAALAVYLESGRPIIFRQQRVGFGGRIFWLLKFRSMRRDAEEDGVPRWASTGDPRITGVGRFLRRARIDELPQIFNVLKGEMSFVGPRPERPYFVSQLGEQVPFYGARHSVKPGLTGWAQVQYRYGSSVRDAVRKLGLDIYYVKNHSLLLDLVILLRTVRVVLLGEGAR